MAFCGNCGQETGREVVYKQGEKYNPATKEMVPIGYPEPLYCDNCRQAMNLNDVSVPVTTRRPSHRLSDLYRRVFDLEILSIQEKALLLALCLYSDYETGESYPSTQRLADDLSITVVHVRFLLAQLLRAGFLEKAGKMGTATVHRLVFNPGKFEDLV